MYKFESYEKFEVKERGTVFGVFNPADTEDFTNLMHETVEIDGDKYVVKGIERFAHNGTHFRGERIGLLVEAACT